MKARAARRACSRAGTFVVRAQAGASPVTTAAEFARLMLGRADRRTVELEQEKQQDPGQPNVRARGGGSTRRETLAVTNSDIATDMNPRPARLPDGRQLRGPILPCQ